VDCLIGDVILISIVRSPIVRAIAKGFAFGKSAAAEDMHLLSLFTSKRASIFVGDGDISFDKDRTFGVTANLKDARFG